MQDKLHSEQDIECLSAGYLWYIVLAISRINLKQGVDYESFQFVANDVDGWNVGGRVAGGWRGVGDYL
jgi:hypothetical protein